jgi:hypothetical protein
MIIGFFFNHLIDRVLRKLIKIKRQGLCWTNGKRLNECDNVAMSSQFRHMFCRKVSLPPKIRRVY